VESLERGTRRAAIGAKVPAMLRGVVQRVAGTCVLALALAGPATAARTSPAQASLLNAMNRTRVAHHLAPLRFDATLTRAAAAHTADMLRRQYFAHGDFSLRMRRFHVAGRLAGENLAWGIGARAQAGTIVAEWLASSEHRANLLSPTFRRVGIATRIGTFAGYSGAAVVTADFAG
jgi:uncharacterized protein YkwD